MKRVLSTNKLFEPFEAVLNLGKFLLLTFKELIIPKKIKNTPTNMIQKNPTNTTGGYLIGSLKVW